MGGDPYKDNFAIKLFLKKGMNVVLSQNFSTNFLLKDDCGIFSVVCNNSQQVQNIQNQFKQVTKENKQNLNGNNIVETILSHEKLHDQFLDECSSRVTNLQYLRNLLIHKLDQIGSKHDWSHLAKQTGVYAYTGMTREMCHELMYEYGICFGNGGRFSLSRLNEDTIDYIACAIHSVTELREYCGIIDLSQHESLA